MDCGFKRPMGIFEPSRANIIIIIVMDGEDK